MGYFNTVYDNFTPVALQYRNTTNEIPLSVISVGYSIFVLSYSGNVYTTGTNSIGQLGLGDATRRNIFTVIPILSNISKIAVNNADIIESGDAAGVIRPSIFAISGTNRSSGFGSVSKLDIESNTLLIVKAGDHRSFRISKAIAPFAFIFG
jgi:alpha-tubulin suppressor-like RCC1 family protein